jgi:glycosyltransferase involved in cell wall biosynthesis
VQIIVLHTFCPSAGDSVSHIAAALSRELESRGHKCEEMRMPFDPASPPLEQILAFRLLEPVEYGDLLISLHPPCHVVHHRRKVIWADGKAFRCGHLMPEGYFRQDPASNSVLASMRVSDRMAFAEARRIFLDSPSSCESFKREEGIEASFLPFPSCIARQEMPKQKILAASLHSASRVQLLLALEAFATVPQDFLLWLFGNLPFSAEQWSSLLRRLGLEDRVKVLPAAQWAESLPAAMGVIGLSDNAGVLGRLAIDAHACDAPVVAFDSPAAAEWIEDGRNGLLSPLDSHALASILTQLTSRPDAMRSLGRAGRERLGEWGANWDYAISAITAP